MTIQAHEYATRQRQDSVAFLLNSGAVVLPANWQCMTTTPGATGWAGQLDGSSFLVDLSRPGS